MYPLEVGLGRGTSILKVVPLQRTPVDTCVPASARLTCVSIGVARSSSDCTE